jgi:phosphoglycolate phosphatase
MTLKAVIFDLDQTLIDSKDSHLAALVDGLEREGWSTKLEWVYGLTAEELLRHNFKNMPEEVVEKVVRRKKMVLKNYLGLLKVLPGAKDLLDFLKGNGIKLVLITNNSHKEIDALLERIGLKSYFDDIVGKEDAEPKPSPHPIIKAMHDLNPPLEETMFVGDSDADISAAKAAGVRIMVTTQCHDTTEQKARADWVVENLKEAKEVIEGLIGEV